MEGKDKMEKEFKTLSEKIRELYDKSSDGKISTLRVEENIKEFIKGVNQAHKILEEDIALAQNPTQRTYCFILFKRRIDKLAGPKLTN